MTTDLRQPQGEASDRTLQKGFTPDQISRLWLEQISNTAQVGNTRSFDQSNILALGFPHTKFCDSAPEANAKGADGNGAVSKADAAEARLKKAFEKENKDPEAQVAFDKHLADFKKRVTDGSLSRDEYTKTLDQISRLMEAKEGKVGKEERMLAARSILYNAAHPHSICQIGGTCGVASTENKIFSKHPSVAAEMVASVALKGEWTGRDGKTIKVPESNLPPEHNKKFPPSPGQPSYASQLFQITAINDIGQHLKPPMTYLRGPKVERKEGNTILSFTPENWVLEDGSKRSFTEKGTGVFSRTGGLTSFEVANEIYRLTGERNGVISNRAHDKDDCPPEQRPPGVNDDNLTDIRSSKDMDSYLKRMKEEGKLPVVVCVSALAVSSLDGKFCFMGQEQDHFVTVDDYRPAADGKPAQIHIHNQWGPNFNGWMKLEDFYKATTNNPIKLKQNEK